jgi:alkylated DNA repair dioxygenase AlkB
VTTQQLDFFGPVQRVLVDDGESAIVYYPDVVGFEEAAAMFARFRDDLQWTQERMWMYDHEVDVPRLRAYWTDAEAVPDDIVALRKRIEAFLGVPFSSVSFNYYRDGRDSVAWHNDHLEELVDRPVIALLSLGAVRPMLIRSKSRPRKTFEIDLEPGSLLVMSGRSQELWEHHIPKLKRAVSPRISVAFRQRRSL